MIKVGKIEYPYMIYEIQELEKDVDYIFIPTNSYGDKYQINLVGMKPDNIKDTSMKTIRVIKYSDSGRACLVNIYSEADGQDYDIWVPRYQEYIIVDKSSEK